MTTANHEISEAQKWRALAAVEQHPLQKEAAQWPYSVTDVFVESKDFVNRTRISDQAKSDISMQLTDAETVIVVIYYTSEKQPEPLSGGGKAYIFLVHPNSYSVLWAEIGTWRL